MDYEIAFDQEEGGYRVFTDLEFTAIAEWVSEFLSDKETLQRVWQAATLAETEQEISNFKHGIFDVVISPEGVAVKRRIDMSQAEDEIKAMFDTQQGFYQASNDGVEAECGLDDLIDLIENWHDIQQ
ncbi:YacL family protein [Marinomonas ostreistagni]|uniref:YacL family protein n=1 Tax=Marinomonas ostreistagni TaxID=359209 RepID=UPI00194E7504|nr:YacL family protein [Marinomonas ostreistagni]MBM6551901.1 YacL family protein [Marinomonas ostreistagni]